MVSIVVPFYGVRPYLAECLDSLVAQTYREIEIILVDDGSTDGSSLIAEDYAARYPHIQVIRQDNQGLSAARNRGARQARGEFLWFVDSDDTVEPQAARTFVTALRNSSSAFAVAPYRRFDSRRIWDAGEWIGRAHQTERLGTDVEQFPAMLVNAVAWSKVYRRSFWDTARLTFPEGVTYEDQPVSARAYAQAKAVDVLTPILYNWRAREDGSSISQQTREEGDLEARLAAAENSLHELAAARGPRLASARAVQLLSYDIPHSTLHMASASQHFRDALAEGVKAIAAHVEADQWTDIPAQHAVLSWLLAQDLQAEALSFIEQGGRDPSQWPTSVVGSRPVVLLPFANDKAIDMPVAVYALAPYQMILRTAVRRAVWESPSLLRIEGWAYIEHVDCAHRDFTTSIAVSDPTTGWSQDLRVERWDNPDVDRVTRHGFNDYRSSAFHAWVDLDTLGAVEAPSNLTFTVTVTTSEVTRSGVLVNPNSWGSAGHQYARTARSGAKAILLASADDPVVLKVTRPTFTVMSAERRGDGIDVVFAAATTAVLPASISVRRAGTRQTLGVPVSPAGDHWRFFLPDSDVGPRRSKRSLEWWVVRCVTRTGKSIALDWPVGSSATPRHVTGRALLCAAHPLRQLRRCAPCPHVRPDPRQLRGSDARPVRSINGRRERLRHRADRSPSPRSDASARGR